MTEQSTDYDSPWKEIIELYFDKFLEFFFPLAYYEPSWSSLETSKNPFAIVVMAHLKSKATKRNPENRLQWKLSLVRMLLESGLSRQDIRQLFRFIDWIMVLPENLAINFKTEIRSYEEARKMRYVTSIERLAKQEGIEEGLEEGRQLGVLQTSQDSVIEVLETRFGELPTSIIDAVNNINDLSVLKTLHKRAISIPSLSEFEQLLPQN
ncbi:hypothetical protein [Trichormus sp. NMC-1]|uniref:hypothetical protein n=1 Tax=Trichormus sp. NMC-1 TaxID=1853259 RepID=UPI0008DC0831|nr:hypothetical protein [Trichormus sp. NMC-1]